jgi:hypothetical protein
VPPFADRSSYWVSFGVAGGSPDDAAPRSACSRQLLRGKALELQVIMNNSHAGCPFCSTFVSVSTSVFKLMGLSNMHRHMNVLDSPADPHLLQYLSRAECTHGVQRAGFELCFTAMQLFDFLWLSHRAHSSHLESIAKITIALMAQASEGLVTTMEGFQSRLSILTACSPNVAVHLHLTRCA